MMTTYYYLVASQKFLEEEAIEKEVLKERIRNYQIGLVIQQNIELDLNEVYANTRKLNPQFNEYLQLHSIGQLNKVLESIVK